MLFQFRHDSIKPDFSVGLTDKPFLVFQYVAADLAHRTFVGFDVGLVTFGAALEFMPADTGRARGEKAGFWIGVELPICAASRIDPRLYDPAVPVEPVSVKILVSHFEGSSQEDAQRVRLHAGTEHVDAAGERAGGLCIGHLGNRL